MRDMNYILMKLNKTFEKLFNRVVFELFLGLIMALKYSEKKEIINV